MSKFFNYLTIDNYAAFICLALSINRYFQGRKWLKIFILFFSFCVCAEVFVSYYLIVRYQNNNMLINYFSFACAGFYLYLYHEYFSKMSWARYLRIIIWVWAFASCGLLLWAGHSAMNYPYNAGMIMTAVLIFLYFYRVLYVEPYRDLSKEGLFYLSLGLILFFLTSFTIMVFYDYLIMNQYMPRLYLKVLQSVNLFIWLGYLGLILCPVFNMSEAKSEEKHIYAARI